MRKNEYVERNIEITPKLREHIRSKGFDVGVGLSRERTLYGESWREQFTTDADIDKTIELLLEADPNLHYETAWNGRHLIRNGDPRLKIHIRELGDHQHISVVYRPHRASWE